MTFPVHDDRLSERRLHRRALLARIGLAACSSAVLGGKLAFANEPARTVSAVRVRGLWFEWDDGTYYYHQVMYNEHGVWLDEHDGYAHCYQDLELADNGVWLTLPDGTCEFHDCLTDAQARQQLDELYWVDA